MARFKRIKVPTLAYGPISVWFDSEWSEYQVRVQGHPKATYHTDDRGDALATAQRMRNDLALAQLTN